MLNFTVVKTWLHIFVKPINHCSIMLFFRECWKKIENLKYIVSYLAVKQSPQFYFKIFILWSKGSKLWISHTLKNKKKQTKKKKTEEYLSVFYISNFFSWSTCYSSDPGQHRNTALQGNNETRWGQKSYFLVNLIFISLLIRPLDAWWCIMSQFFSKMSLRSIYMKLWNWIYIYM